MTKSTFPCHTPSTTRPARQGPRPTGPSPFPGGRLCPSSRKSGSAASVRNSRGRGMARSPSGFDYYSGGMYSGIGNWLNYYYFQQNLTPSTPDVGAATGVTHQKQTTLKYPISSRLVFHAGRSHQRADDTLVRIAAAGKSNANAGFKLQSDLSNNSDERADYWTQNHRLLDTAYVVAEFTIAEGDTTIPELDFVVRGKEIEQYNYDFSYRQHPNPTFSDGTITDKRALFKVNNFVDFYRLDNSGANNGRLATGVQIMDVGTGPGLAGSGSGLGARGSGLVPI